MTLSEEQLEAVLHRYGHSFVRVDFVQSGYRNTSHIVETSTGLLCNLIVYKREDGIAERIRRVNAFSRHLRDAGLPVRVPLDERLLQLHTGEFLHYACLYSFEHGATIPWEAYAMKHIKLLGSALAKLHVAARSYEGVLPSVAQEYLSIVARMERYFADPDVVKAIREKLDAELQLPFADFRTLLEATDRQSDQQALHMDFVRGNVLFRPAEEGDVLVVDSVALSGILDLEKAAFGHPAFDLARTLAFLLVDCNKSAEKVRKYFLQSGYVKRGGGYVGVSAEDSTRPLEELTTLFLVYDFYKFLRQNPYESLAKNHHFVRTRDILVERKVLQ